VELEAENGDICGCGKVASRQTSSKKSSSHNHTPEDLQQGAVMRAFKALHIQLQGRDASCRKKKSHRSILA
jgi:hypothetical protein